MQTSFKTNRLKIGDKNAKAMCDRTGITCRKQDLVKQMEYNGSGLYWTGLYVHKNVAYKPNPASLIPPVFKDPRSVLNTRVPYNDVFEPIQPKPVPIFPFSIKSEG